MRQIYNEFEKNPIVWGMYYFPHYFRLESPPFHVKIINEALTNKHLAIQAPRESAKSSLICFLYLFHSIVFGRKKHIGVLQNTYDKATQRLEAIKDEVKNNEKFKKDFGVTCERDTVGDTIFLLRNKERCRVFCRGLERLGSVRGELFGPLRPDLLLFDDLEDDKFVQNPQLRRELEDIFNQAIIPAVDKVSGQIIVIGTKLHDDCLMAKLVSKDFYPEFRKLFYIARFKLKDDYKSLWPEKWSLDFFKDLEKNKPEVFAKEYQGDPVTGNMRTFYKEDFRYWREENNEYVLLSEENKVIKRGRLSDCKAAIGCDLAWDDDRRSDSTAVVPALLTPDSDILIGDYFHEKGCKPDTLAGVLFHVEQKYRLMTGKPVPIGFEKGKIEKFSKWFLKKAMAENNRFLILKDIKWGTDKITRIITPLQPRYRNKAIYHKTNMGELENQLLRFPDGTHDDLPDALQVITQILEIAPAVKKQEYKSEDPKFDLLRKMIIERKKGKKYILGKRGNRFELPARLCPI